MFDRMKEPSTWASIAATLGMFSTMFPPLAIYLQAGAGVAGALGFALKEQSAPAAAPAVAP